jgi:membrane-associated protease RseP (regulator of RpoE activity)
MPGYGIGAADEGTGWGSDNNIVRVAQNDRDRDGDSDSGYLGVQVQRLTAALRRAKGIPESTEGSLVNNVEGGGPADDAGIKRGDVILEVNHDPTSNPSDLVQIVRGLDPGKRVSVKIWRDGVTRTIDVKVGSRPEGSDLPAPPRTPGWEGPGGGRGTDDGDRTLIIRGNQSDLERQIKDLQEQITRIEGEVKELRSQVEQGRRGRGSDDRDRNVDRDRDNNDY